MNHLYLLGFILFVMGISYLAYLKRRKSLKIYFLELAQHFDQTAEALNHNKDGSIHLKVTNREIELEIYFQSESNNEEIDYLGFNLALKAPSPLRLELYHKKTDWLLTNNSKHLTSLKIPSLSAPLLIKSDRESIAKALLEIPLIAKTIEKNLKNLRRGIMSIEGYSLDFKSIIRGNYQHRFSELKELIKLAFLLAEQLQQMESYEESVSESE